MSIDVSTDHHPVFTLLGERVALGPLSEAIVPWMQRWHNDFVVNRTHSDPPSPYTLDQAREWYAQQPEANQRSIGFAIYERATRAPIGVAFLLDIDWRQRSCEYGITIGEASHRGRGLGTEVTRLLLDYAFTTLGLRRMLLTVSAFNLAGIHAYQRCGFRELGRRHACWWMGGRVWDRVYMECRSDSHETEFDQAPDRTSAMLPLG